MIYFEATDFNPLKVKNCNKVLGKENLVPSWQLSKIKPQIHLNPVIAAFNTNVCGLTLWTLLF